MPEVRTRLEELAHDGDPRGADVVFRDAMRVVRRRRIARRSSTLVVIAAAGSAGTLVVLRDGDGAPGVEVGDDVVTSSSGPPGLVVVPDVSGYTRSVAAEVMQHSGFTVGLLADVSGVVLRTEPPAGNDALPGSVVSLVVDETPAIRVPDVTGLSREDAERALDAAGLVVGILAPNAVVPLRVTSSDPPPGTEVRAGDKVIIFLGP